MMKRAVFLVVVLVALQAVVAVNTLEPKKGHHHRQHHHRRHPSHKHHESHRLAQVDADDVDTDSLEGGNGQPNGDGTVDPVINENEPEPYQDGNQEHITPVLTDKLEDGCEPNCPAKHIEEHVVPEFYPHFEEPDCRPACGSGVEYMVPELKDEEKEDTDGPQKPRIVQPNAIPDTHESDSNDEKNVNDQFEEDANPDAVDEEAAEDDDDVGEETLNPQAALDELEDAGSGEGAPDLAGKVTHTTTTVITETTGPAGSVKKSDPEDIAAAAQKAVEAAQAEGSEDEDEKMMPLDEINKSEVDPSFISKIAKLRNKRRTKKN